MELSIFLKQHQDVVKALNDQAEAAERAASAHNRYANAAERAAAAANAVGGAGGAPGGAGGAGGGGGQRQQRQPPSFMQRMGRLAYSTRINAGPASPLLGQMLSAVGAGPAAPYVGMAMAIMGAVQALHSLSESADAAARNIIRQSDAAHASGQTMGSLHGLGVGAGDAIDLKNRIASDPYAMGQAGRLGISVVPGPYGTMDSGKVMEQALDGLRRIKDQGERERMMYQLGLERFKPLMRVSDSTYETLKFEGGMLGNESAVRARQLAESDAASQRLSTAFERLWNAANPLTDAFTDMKNTTAEIVNFVTTHMVAIRASGQIATGDFWGAGKTMYNGIKAREEAQALDKSEQAAAALDDNTKSNEKLNVAIGRLTQRMEMLGGGPNAANAVPAAMMRGDNLQVAIERGMFPLGAI